MLEHQVEQIKQERIRIFNLCDALLRRAQAHGLKRLGAQELDTYRLELDTPFDGVLVTLGIKHAAPGARITQLVANNYVPAPNFVANVLGFTLTRCIVTSHDELDSVNTDILIVDGGLLDGCLLTRLIGSQVQLITIFPISPEETSTLISAVTAAGFAHHYRSPACDYLIAWR
jgi:hypothetical protein